jgi:L-lactate dehydrogenase complex protein LldE
LGLTPNLVNLIQRIEGLDLRRLPHEEECCGFGGSFTVKQPEVSVAIARAKLEEVEQSGARILVSEDLSCLTHLQATAEGDGHTLETWTIAELLDRALND